MAEPSPSPMPYRPQPQQAPLSEHFAQLADRYRGLRDLDVGTARRVARMLAAHAGAAARLTILDLGAGTGRYTEAVNGMTEVEKGISCHCVACDANPAMLSKATPLESEGGVKLSRVVALAELLPFAHGAFDALLSFNAVHHFHLDAFLEQAARVLRANGLLIVYTRTPNQNERTVWGRFFPEFAARETRLFTEEYLLKALAARPEFESVSLCPAAWSVQTTVARLLEQARGRNYSTFRFYTAKAFEAALETFEARVRAAYSDASRIHVQNDHTLIVARTH